MELSIMLGVEFNHVARQVCLTCRVCIESVQKIRVGYTFFKERNVPIDPNMRKITGCFISLPLFPFPATSRYTLSRIDLLIIRSLNFNVTCREFLVLLKNTR